MSAGNMEKRRHLALEHPVPAFVCETSNWPSGQPGALSPVNLSRARAGVPPPRVLERTCKCCCHLRVFPSLTDDRWPGRIPYTRPSTGHTGQDSGSTRSLFLQCVWSHVCPCADRYAYTYTQVWVEASSWHQVIPLSFSTLILETGSFGKPGTQFP